MINWKLWCRSALLIVVLSIGLTAVAQERGTGRFVRETRVKCDEWGQETTYDVTVPVRRGRRPNQHVPSPSPVHAVEVPPDPPIDETPAKIDSWQFPKLVSIPSLVAVNRTKLTGSIDCGVYAIGNLVSLIGREVNNDVLDRIVRDADPEGDGVATDQMVDYLKSFFHVTELKTGRIDQLTEHIDRGLPAVLVVETPRGPHWVLVNGYQTDERGEIKTWKLIDAGIVKATMSHTEFVKAWYSEQYRNYCILVRPRYSPDFMQIVLNAAFQRQATEERANTSAAHPKPVDSKDDWLKELQLESKRLGGPLLADQLRRKKPNRGSARSSESPANKCGVDSDDPFVDPTATPIGTARRYLYGIPIVLLIQGAIILAARRLR